MLKDKMSVIRLAVENCKDDSLRERALEILNSVDDSPISDRGIMPGNKVSRKNGGVFAEGLSIATISRIEPACPPGRLEDMVQIKETGERMRAADITVKAQH